MLLSQFAVPRSRNWGHEMWQGLTAVFHLATNQICLRSRTEPDTLLTSMAGGSFVMTQGVQVQNGVAPASKEDAAPRATGDTVRLGAYQSLNSLATILRQIDQDYELRQPTIVLVLARNFSGHLPSIIQRRNWGGRLILVVEDGHVPLPGMVTFAELASRESLLGWSRIVFERNLDAAINGALETRQKNEPLIVLCPEWLTHAIPLGGLERHCCQLQTLLFR